MTEKEANIKSSERALYEIKNKQKSIEEDMKPVYTSLKDLRQLLKGNTEVIIVTFKANQEQRNYLKNLTKNFNWHFFDLWGAIDKEYNMEDLTFIKRDGHPNKKGHEIMGNYTYNFLRRNILN